DSPVDRDDSAALDGDDPYTDSDAHSNTDAFAHADPDGFPERLIERDNGRTAGLQRQFVRDERDLDLEFRRRDKRPDDDIQHDAYVHEGGHLFDDRFVAGHIERERHDHRH